MLPAQQREKIASYLTIEGLQNECKLRVPCDLGETKQKNPRSLERRSSKHSASRIYNGPCAT